LLRRQVIEANRRHLGQARLCGGQEPAVTRDHIVFAIDQDRNIEAECLDTVADLADLFLLWRPLLDRWMASVSAYERYSIVVSSGG